MSALDLPALLGTAHEAAHAASIPIRALYGRGIAAQHKEGDARNLVTEADLAADAAIGRLLRERYPDHLILSEESPAPDGVLDPEIPTWVVDPVDGTSNFAHGLPLFSISIGLYHAGEPQVGVIVAPLLGWHFAALAGGGATLNEQPLRVSERRHLADCIVDSDWPRRPALRRQALATYSALGEAVHTLRSFGSAALGFAAVAAGWVDLYYNLTLAPWDMAAGSLIVREAGGHLTAADGTPWSLTGPTVLVSNGLVHEETLALLGSLPSAAGSPPPAAPPLESERWTI